MSPPLARSHSVHRCRFALALALAFTPVAATGCYDDAPLDVAPSVDLSRFQGKWYEIAKLPRTTEADCTGTVASYELLPSGDLSVESHCQLGRLDGPVKSMTATAKVPDPAVPAKLAVNFGGFYGDYWILEVGGTYDFAVVGHPSREYLWVLSRTPKLEAATLSRALSHARDQKFEIERLEYTLQAP